MPWVRPTLTELNRLALGDLQNAPGGDGSPLLRRAISRSNAWALANQANGLHGHLDWIALQSTPMTATGEFLEAWAALVNVYREGAVPWAGSVTFPAVPSTLLTSGTMLGSDGQSYVTQGDAVATSSSVVVATAAAVGAGTAYDLVVGDAVTLTAGVAGITGTGAVSAVEQPGVDVETDSALRTRMLQRWANTPQGGALADYVQWAQLCPGVTRAWVNPNGAGAGSVVVYPMFDDAEAGFAGFPQGTNGVAAAETRGSPATGDQLLVANVIFPLRPVTSLVLVCAPVADAINFVIRPVSALSSAVQSAAVAALAATFTEIASPLGGRAAILPLDPFNEALEGVPGMPEFTMLSPAVPIAPALGSLPTMGTLTYG